MQRALLVEDTQCVARGVNLEFSLVRQWGNIMKYAFFVITIFVVAFLYGNAEAGGPSFRHCDAGYFTSQTEGNLDFGQNAPFRGNFESRLDDADGFGIDCELGLKVSPRVTGLVFGEYQRFDLNLNGTSVFPDGCGLTPPPQGLSCPPTIVDTQSEFSLGGNRFRAGVGAGVDVAFGAAFYGKVGISALITDERLSSAIDSSVLLGGVREDDVNAFGEVGLRWQLLDRVEAGVFGLYDGAGAVEQRVEQDADGINVSSIVADEDWRGGFELSIKAWGPAWLTARYEIGDQDTAFAGLRLAF